MDGGRFSDDTSASTSRSRRDGQLFPLTLTSTNVAAANDQHQQRIRTTSRRPTRNLEVVTFAVPSDASTSDANFRRLQARPLNSRQRNEYVDVNAAQIAANAVVEENQRRRGRQQQQQRVHLLQSSSSPARVHLPQQRRGVVDDRQLFTGILFNEKKDCAELVRFNIIDDIHSRTIDDLQRQRLRSASEWSSDFIRVERTTKKNSNCTVVTEQPRRSTMVATLSGDDSNSKVVNSTTKTNSWRFDDLPVGGQPKKKLDTNSHVVSDALLCRECGKCRCYACREPKQLPERNFECGRVSCVCNAAQLVDKVSCAFCVRGCWYHFSDEDDDRRRYGDQLGSGDGANCCGPSTAADCNCCLRYGCLAAALLLLPCIWCYFPMKCCAWTCGNCYARYYDNRCRCVDERRRSYCESHADLAQQRRLTSSKDSEGLQTSKTSATNGRNLVLMRQPP